MIYIIVHLFFLSRYWGRSLNKDMLCLSLLVSLVETIENKISPLKIKLHELIRYASSSAKRRGMLSRDKANVKRNNR